MNGVLGVVSFAAAGCEPRGRDTVGSRSLPVPLDPGERPGYPWSGSPAVHTRQPIQRLPLAGAINQAIRPAAGSSAGSLCGHATTIGEGAP